MSSKSVRSFIRDESGGYTVWSLIWFSLYVAMGGLAVDVTDAYRMRTQLQSTADAAALAGAMSLPDATDAVNQAVAHAKGNMAVSSNGNVLEPEDVRVGNWDAPLQRFTEGGAPLNAIRVITRRSDRNLNPLATNFLRILSIWGIPLDRWNISTEAVAIRYVPECLMHNGMVALNQVDVTSGNYFQGICIHGQNEIPDSGHDYAIDFNNGNIYEGVEVSMPDLKNMPNRQNMCDSNPGLCDPGTLVEGDMWPTDVKQMDAIIAGLTTVGSDYIPDYMTRLDPLGLIPINPIVVTKNENFAGPYLPYHIYDINCSNASKTLSLPKNAILDKVIIVADCKIGAASGGTIRNSILATSALGNGSAPADANVINLPSSWTVGDSAFCSGGGGQVGIYAKASVHIAAKATISGLRAVVGGNFALTALGDVAGISIEAGDSISATAGGKFTYCGGVFEDKFAYSYRLVR